MAASSTERGNPSFPGSVGVKDDEIVVIRGDASRFECARRIDARGPDPCPGFIDIHAHSGLVLLADKGHHAKVLQGVTTELVGAPRPLLRTVQETRRPPGPAPAHAVSMVNPALDDHWTSVGSYLDLFDDRSPVNVAVLVGNTALRISAIGWTNVRATTMLSPRCERCSELPWRRARSGCRRASTTRRGPSPTPRKFVALAKEAGDLGGIYHTHVRYRLGNRYLDPHREAIDIGRQSGAPVHITHLAPRNSYPSAQGLLRLVESAAADGVDITFDCHPSLPGVEMRNSILFPDWIHEGGPEELKTRLRRRLQAQGPVAGRGDEWARRRLG